MRTIHRIGLMWTAVMLMWAVAVPARGAVAEVKDGGGFFSPAAVAKANQRLSQIAQQSGRDLRIETYAQIPQEMHPRYSKDQEAQFFANWADQRAQQIGVRGVMVLINRNPRYLTVQVGRQTRQSGAFTTADEARLRDALLKSFRAGNYDQGLTEAIDQFQQAVQKRPGGTATPAVPPADNPSGLPGAPPAPYRLPGEQTKSAPTGSANPGASRSTGGSIFGCWTIVFFAILIVCGIWLFRRLFGSRTNYGNPYSGGYDGGNPPNYPTGQYPPPGYGRGGFGRGFGGGILGGLLGGWLGSRMFGHNPAQGAPPPQDQAGGWNEPPAPPPSEFGGGGDPSGGGSFGGGDDFGGGGDIGGGGDFGGGGDPGGGGSF